MKEKKEMKEKSIKQKMKESIFKKYNQISRNKGWKKKVQREK